METGNGKVLVKTTYSTNTPLCTSLCTDAPPPPSPIKDRFLLQEASVLATLHQPFCIALTQGFISPWAFKTTNEDYKMRGHFMQKNTIKKHEMTGKTGGWSSPFFSFFGGRWLSIFSPMLPSWNRPKFKCPPITVNQSQFLFISNFNREIMQSVQLFICSVWILRDGYQPRFIQFAMLSTGYPTLPSVVPKSPVFRGYKSLVVYNSAHYHCRFCLSVRHFIVKKSCDNISTGYEKFLRYLFVLRLRSINYRVVIMPHPAK